MNARYPRLTEPRGPSWPLGPTDLLQPTTDAGVAALRDVQARLEIRVDGILGPQTWAALWSESE